MFTTFTTTMKQAMFMFLMVSIGINMHGKPAIKPEIQLGGRLSLSLSSWNELKKIDLTGVRYLDLSGNDLGSVPKGAFKNVKGIQNLRSLNLSNNNLSIIEPGAFNGLDRLWVLILNNNKIKSLKPKTLSNMPRLKWVSFYNNPLSKQTLNDIQKQIPRAYIWNAPITKNLLKKAGFAAVLITTIMAAALGYYVVKKKKQQLPPDIPVPSNESRIPADPSELRGAVIQGDADRIRQLLETGVNVNAQDKYGNAALIMAAGSGKTAVVEQLIRAGADVNAQDIIGNTALIAAAMNGKTAVVEQLLREPGIDVNAQNHNGNTALIVAAREGHAAVVEQLLRAPGINVNAQNHNGYTALMMAAMHGYIDLVEQLIQADADVNLSNNRGFTALNIAEQWGHVNVVNRLLRAGAQRHHLGQIKLESNITLEELRDITYEQFKEKNPHITKGQFKSLQEQGRCPICLDQFDSEGEVSSFLTQCSHLFHTKCLQKWLDTGRSTTCPLCHQDIFTSGKAERIPSQLNP